MAEYFFKGEGDEDETGPVSLEQLRYLAKEGILHGDIQVRETDGWTIVALSELLGSATEEPAAKKLSLKRGVTPGEVAAPVLPPGSTPRKVEVSADKTVEIDNILSAAEGKTAASAHSRRLRDRQERLAGVLLPGIMVLLLVSGASFLWLERDLFWRALQNYDFLPLLGHPLVILGVIDIALGLCVGLGSEMAFRLARARGGLGVGFFLVAAYAVPDFVLPLCWAAVSLLLLVAMGAKVRWLLLLVVLVAVSLSLYAGFQMASAGQGFRFY